VITTLLHLAEGRLVRVSGPLTVSVVDGQVLVLGAIFSRGSSFHVDEFKSYGVKALVDSSLKIYMSPGASVEEPQSGEEPLDLWVSRIDDVMRRGCSSLAVMGPTDAGKSSVAALAANRALLRGLRTGVVDADIGQADIGPPAFVSASIVEKPILSLRELRPLYQRFVGSISPQRFERRVAAALVESVLRLRAEEGVDFIVVDTDGWVQGVNAVEYKLEALRLSGIESIVVMGDRELYRLVDRMYGRYGCGVVYLPSPAQRRIRDRGARRILRSRQYRAVLSGSRPRRISMSDVSVQGSCLFAGTPLTPMELQEIGRILGVKVLAASVTGDALVAVVAEKPRGNSVARLESLYERQQVYLVEKGSVKGVLAAVVDERGREHPALVDDIDFATNTITLYTPFEGEVRGIVFGNVRLNEDYVEVGRPSRCLL